MTDLPDQITPPQWAMEKADELGDAIVTKIGEAYEADQLASEDRLAAALVSILARALVEARQAGRREALEEAADVADQYDGEGLDGGYDCHLGDARRTQRDIAAAIRKLMEKNE